MFNKISFRKNIFFCSLPLLLATEPVASEVNISFAKDKWDSSQWIGAKSPRFNYLGKMVQEDDHIVNATPPLSDEEIFKKHLADVYSCIIYNRKISGNKIEISSKMSFDHRMAPLIMFCENVGKSKNGDPELREHFEVVLYDEGINVWHHTYKNGKSGWHLAAFLNEKFLPKKVYDLKITLEKKNKFTQMTIECGGKKFGYQDEDFPFEFYAGLIGCEGRCRFYDFNIKDISKK